MGLVARVVEEFGVPTVTVSTGRDITALVRPPRSLFVNFPMGNSFGMAGNTEMQTKILREQVIACYRKEGVNHYENCKDVVTQYLARIQAPDFGMVGGGKTVGTRMGRR